MIIRGDEPIFIIRKSEDGVDDYGNPIYTTSQILVRDALFAFGATGEPVDVSRDPVDAALTLYLPEGTTVLDGDEFEIRNTIWVKDGEPVEYPQLWAGFVPSIVLSIRRRRG